MITNCKFSHNKGYESPVVVALFFSLPSSTNMQPFEPFLLRLPLLALCWAYSVFCLFELPFKNMEPGPSVRSDYARKSHKSFSFFPRSVYIIVCRYVQLFHCDIRYRRFKDLFSFSFQTTDVHLIDSGLVHVKSVP